MKFTAVVLALAASAVALPNVGPSGAGAQKGKQMSQPGAKQEQFWPVAPNVSVDEAKAACGNQNQIACCDDVSFAGDTTEISSGPLAGALSDLLGGKNGAKGLGLFDKCSKLNIDLIIGISDLVNSQCKANIACCQNNNAESNGDLIGLNIPCVALGSLL